MSQKFELWRDEEGLRGKVVSAKGCNDSSIVRASTLPEAAATSLSHESHDDALDEVSSHGDDQESDAVLPALFRLWGHLNTFGATQSRLEGLNLPLLLGIHLL